MHVEDIAIYDTTFVTDSLESAIKDAGDSAAKYNLRQLGAVAAICNAATFQNDPTGEERLISGDATGKLA
jgi:sodium/potassium-transporting ATPase subunit alpha